jgi:hypothetical protein
MTAVHPLIPKARMPVIAKIALSGKFVIAAAEMLASIVVSTAMRGVQAADKRHTWGDT